LIWAGATAEGEFISADERLIDAAGLEGLDVILI
jgi:hypothetical protein